MGLGGSDAALDGTRSFMGEAVLLDSLSSSTGWVSSSSDKYSGTKLLDPLLRLLGRLRVNALKDICTDLGGFKSSAS